MNILNVLGTMIKEGVIVVLLFSCLHYSGFCQTVYVNDTCYQDVWIKSFKKNIPNEVCIPLDYHISEIYNNTDFNQDGITDFIFDWNKKKLSNGDTIYVSIYKATSDSTFYKYATFNNLYPIYFKHYDFEYEIEDSVLNELKGKYNSVNPLISLNFDNGFIVLKIESEAKGGYVFTWKFNSRIDNWEMIKIEFWNEWNEEGKTEIKKLQIPDKKRLINEFNMFNFL